MAAITNLVLLIHPLNFCLALRQVQGGDMVGDLEVFGTERGPSAFHVFQQMLVGLFNPLHRIWR